jgi:gamma-glutamyltranspeptidase/glutathione hydrolase
VQTPRYHQQYSPDVVEYEPGAFTVPMQHALEIRGHHLKQSSAPYGDMQAIFWDKKNNRMLAASDPRGQGLAVVETISQKNEKPVIPTHKL